MKTDSEGLNIAFSSATQTVATVRTSNVDDLAMEQTERVEESTKKAKKLLCGQDILHVMKVAMEQELQQCDWEENMERRLQTITDSPDAKRYVDIFCELCNVDTETSENYCLENILEKLVQTKNIMPSKEAKKNIFAEWAKLLPTNNSH